MIPPSRRPPYLYRYMQLPEVLHMLTVKSLTLKTVTHWKDRSEASVLDKYLRHLGKKKLFALCFTQGAERIHYWGDYGMGDAGVCVSFSKVGLIKLFKDDVHKFGLRGDAVEYVKIDKALNHPSVIDKDKWGFVKRWAFKDEREYRVLCGGGLALTHLDLDLNLNSIISIKLGPSLSLNKVESIRKVITSIPGCKNMNVHQSKILNNRKWIESFVE
jgi:hypothetical protein